MGKIDDDLIKELWAEGRGLSLRSIARQLGVSHVSILKRLRKLGVKPYVQTLPKKIGSAQEKEAGNFEFCDKYTRARLPEGITVQKKTPPYFIKEGTDEIFGYTRFLAERADMKPFWGTLEEFRAKIADQKKEMLK